MASTTVTKKLEAEIPILEYRFFRTIAKTEGKTVREAIKEAIKDWVVRRKKTKEYLSDPLFNERLVFNVKLKHKAREVDNVLYRRG